MARTFVWHPSKGPRQDGEAESSRDGKRTDQAGPERHRALVAHARARSRRSASSTTRTWWCKPITPGLKGQLKQVRHLVEVTVEEAKRK